jgi:hypothetical protein
MRYSLQAYRSGFARIELACLIAGIVLIQGYTISWIVKRDPTKPLASNSENLLLTMPRSTRAVESREQYPDDPAVDTVVEVKQVIADRPPVVEPSPVVPQVATVTEQVQVQPAAPLAAPVVAVRQEPVAAIAPQAEACKPAVEKVAPAQCVAAACKPSPSLGTVLAWTPSLAEASRRALKEDKLIFLIHVSGNFADPGFT